MLSPIALLLGIMAAMVARPWPLPRAAYPAGGIACSVHDLLAYAKFHLGDGHTPDGEVLLSADSLAQMQTPHAAVWAKECWGLSWAINDTYAVRMVSHGGGTMGQVSQLIVVPEKDFAVAVFTNADPAVRLLWKSLGLP